MLLSLCWVLSSFAVAQQPSNTQQPSPASQNPTSPEQATPGTESKANPATENATPNKKAAPEIPAIKNDVVIKGGTILTVTHGKIENGSIYIHNGKIAAVGQSVNAPAGASVIDAAGKFVMPGIIDSHSHIALDDDVNEPTSPVTPHMMMRDAFDYSDKAIYRTGRRRYHIAAAAWFSQHDWRTSRGNQTQIRPGPRRVDLSRSATIHQVCQR